MHLNTKVVLLTSLLSGCTIGVMELVFPLYLDSLKVSMSSIGLIFSIATLVTMALEIFLGEYTDIHGRKIVYSLSSVLTSASGLFPFLRNLWSIATNKVFCDLGTKLSASFSSIMFFESDRKLFSRIIAISSGGQHLMMAAIMYVISMFVYQMSFSGCFFLASIVQIASLIIFFSFYRERGRQQTRKLSLKETYSFDLSRNLWALTFVSILTMTTFVSTHTFVFPLYLKSRYGLDTPRIAFFAGTHRFVMAVALLLFGNLVHKLDMRRAFMFSQITQTLSHLSMSLIDDPYIGISVWYIHDLLGGALEIPTLTTLVQTSARTNSLGKDVNTSAAIKGVAMMPVPACIGILASIDYNLPYYLGSLTSLIAMILFYLTYRPVKPAPKHGTIQ